MVNLYSLEELALDRQRGMARQPLRRSLLQQAADASPGLRAVPTVGSSAQSRVGLLLVRVGLRPGNVGLPQKRAGTLPCVCVPVNY